MQIVINVPNWLYNAMLEHKEPIYSQSLAEAVRDGTPLPKGHGRLIDADKLDNAFWEEIACESDFCGKFYDESKEFDRYSVEMIIDKAPTIIEADKEQIDGNDD